MGWTSQTPYSRRKRSNSHANFYPKWVTGTCHTSQLTAQVTLIPPTNRFNFDWLVRFSRASEANQKGVAIDNSTDWIMGLFALRMGGVGGFGAFARPESHMIVEPRSCSVGEASKRILHRWCMESQVRFRHAQVQVVCATGSFRRSNETRTIMAIST